MSDLHELYQEVILDHNREPRNFRKLEPKDAFAEGYNPLCGDQLKVYLNFKEGLISEIGFEGTGCAISKASGSLMTLAVKGKSKEEAKRLFEDFVELVTGKKSETDRLGKLAVFAGVADFPARVKCATLAWHTLRQALEGKKETVSTEE